MILRRLLLKNYRKYRSADLEFSPGLIAVVGKNGVGQTTLLEAVAFALYGPSAARDDLLGCVSEFCGPSDQCVLELEFSVRGQPHRVLRRLRQKGTPQHQAELFEGSNPNPVANGPSAVEAAVRRKLGMDYLAFTRSVFSKQKEVNALSAAKPEERRKAIRRMVGIEAISRACDEVRQDAKIKRAAIETARRAIELLPNKQKEAQVWTKALGPARRARSTAQEAAATAGKAALRARAILKDLNDKRGRDELLQQRKAGLEADLRGGRREVEGFTRELADIAEKRQELAALLPSATRFRQVALAKAKLDRASGQHEEKVRLEAESDDLRAEVATAGARVAQFAGATTRVQQATKDERTAAAALRRANSKLEALQKARGQANQRLGGLRSQCDRVQNALAQIKREGSTGKCPTCYRELGETYDEILTHLRKELGKHQTALGKAQHDVEGLEEELRNCTAGRTAAECQVAKAARSIKTASVDQQKLRESRKRLSEAKQRLRGNQTRLKALRGLDYDAKRHQEINSRYQQLAKVHDRIEALREAVRREPAAKRAFAATRRRIAEAETALERSEHRRAAVGFDRTAHQAAQRDTEATQKSHRSTAVALANARAELKQVQERLEMARRAVKELQRQKELIADDEEHVRYLERLEALLKEFREDLAARVKPEIEEYASALLNQVTAGRYPRIELDDHYGISLSDGSASYPLRRFSGGEEDLANLCLRLAISQVVSSRHSGDDASLVVLDEVFGSQDSERRESILQALVRLSETFQQVVLITHTEDLHDRVPSVLRVTENAAREAQAAWM